MEQQPIRKIEFARLRGVSPGRVSQWIARGKIHGDALVGEGQEQGLINADIARAQLRDSLDVSQRFGLKGLGTRLGEEPPARPSADPAPIVQTIDSRIKAEKLRQAQLMTSRLEEEDRQRRGLYVEAKAVRGEMARLAAELSGSFEGSLTDLSAALAGQFHIPARDVLHVLRKEFRRIRERLAGAHAAAAAAEPRTISRLSRTSLAA